MFLFDRFWIDMVSHKPAFPAWRVQTHVGGTCMYNELMHLYYSRRNLILSLSFSFGFPFLSFSISPPLFLCVFLSLPLILHDRYIIGGRFIGGIQIRMLRYIIVINGWRTRQCLARDQRSVPTINTSHFSPYRIMHITLSLQCDAYLLKQSK